MPNSHIGVDVGGTKIAAGIVRGSHAVRVTTIPTPKTGRREVVAAIVQLVKTLDGPRSTRVGIGIAGAVNAAKGIVYSSPNLPPDFKNVPLARLVARAVRRPTRIENDAKCFALAEATLGAGRGKRIVAGFTLGSGIGFGIVMDGKILHGRGGIAGELGHTTVVEDGLPCSCGQRGHLESYASGRSMTRLYRRLTGKTVNSFELERRAKDHEAAARRVVAYGAEILAIGLANAMTTFNPDIIVLGGGLSRVPIYWRPAARRASQLVPYRQFLPTPIVKAKFGSQAGLIGAALVANT
ncbi:MAG: glucokinase [Parcubacteria group bacterium Gr01-1014_31]|nr:MAG: glucokinase [Parcubacteria group bacterium Gr01-1014_31]